jgi:glycogen debranching enzyme
VDRALAWLARKSAENEAGYVTYDGVGEGGQPINQSWRDSGTGVLRADGSYPAPPLALVEVQGYAYQARLLIAGLLRRAGENGQAERLEAEAAALRTRFLRDFWMEQEGCYCLALEQGGRQVTSVSSNAAQVLWTGIATPEHARRIAERMMRPDMFSGWGIRTMSSDHVRFDPLAYQQGSVWAFDNSLIVSGLRRYGEDAAALRVTQATLDAGRGFRLSRLPEFVAGTQRLSDGDGGAFAVGYRVADPHRHSGDRPHARADGDGHRRRYRGPARPLGRRRGAVRRADHRDRIEAELFRPRGLGEGGAGAQDAG